MECMKDFVGFYQGCNAPVPTPLSGLFLTQLPGITFQEEDETASSDQVTANGLWNDLQTTAIQVFRSDVINEFGLKYQLRQITQQVDLGLNINTSILTPNVAGVSNGILMETMQQNAQCACSNLMQIYVQSINFYWQGTNPSPTLTLTFQDADTLTIESTIVVPGVVPGWNQVWIDTTFAARRLYMLASGNFDNYVQLDISDFNLDNFGGYNWGQGNGGWLMFNYGGCGCQTRLNGVSYTSAGNQANVITNTYGMSCQFSTRCSFDSIVCVNKRHFALAWQYCLAIEFLNYVISSPRMNRWTTTQLDKAETLRDLFVLKYRGGIDSGTDVRKIKMQYPGILQTAISSYTLNDYDCCLKSNSYIIWKEIIT